MSLTNFVREFSKVYFDSKEVNILESGADSGVDTEYFCKTFPNGKVYAFEPDPRRHSNLVNMSSRYPNLRYENFALGIENKDVDFYLSSKEENGVSETWGSSSILKPKQHLDIHPQIKFTDQPIKVRSVNLDSWMKDNLIESFDMMWLDMQGYEYDVLESSPKSTDKCHFIYSEVQLIESYQGNKLYESLKSLLGERGFIPIIEELPWEDAGNVLFFRQELAENAVSIIKSMMTR